MKFSFFYLYFTIILLGCQTSLKQDKLEKIYSQMSLEEQVGQLFIIRCPQQTPLSKIALFKPGGIILFGKDFENKTPQIIRNNILTYQNCSTYPLLIAVDEEGGRVNRISQFPTFRTSPFQSPQTLFSQGGLNNIKADTQEKAIFLKKLGINLNLAPVCDISTNPQDYIYSRTLGLPAKQTAQYVQTVIKTMHQFHLGATLKHFPGYGNNIDTHSDIAHDHRSFKNFQENDFLPFIAGIKENVGSILVSHNIVTQIDPHFPASLSPKIHQILRKELLFNGVIITDDLYMQAIKKYTEEQNAAVLAILAGNDLICSSDFEIQIPAVIEAVKKNIISQKQIKTSVLRILKWKQTLNLLP